MLIRTGSKVVRTLAFSAWALVMATGCGPGEDPCSVEAANVVLVLDDGPAFNVELGDRWLAPDAEDALVVTPQSDVVLLAFSCQGTETQVVNDVVVECNGTSAKVFAAPARLTRFSAPMRSAFNDPADGTPYDVEYTPQRDACGVNAYEGALVAAQSP